MKKIKSEYWHIKYGTEINRLSEKICIFVSGEFEEEAGDESDSGSEMGGGATGSATQDLCLPALEYLKRCCQILSKMWTMPACPVFNGAQRCVLLVHLG